MSDNDNGPKLVTLAHPKSEIAAAGESVRRNMEVLIENQITIAKIRRAAFLAYVAEGFTEQQALELCCK